VVIVVVRLVEKAGILVIKDRFIDSKGLFQRLDLVDRMVISDAGDFGVDVTVVGASCDRRMAGLRVVGVGLVAVR